MARGGPSVLTFPMLIPPTGRVLAVDWGQVRIGLAVTDEAQLIASPMETLVRRKGKRFPMPRFLALLETFRPAGIVVGLPLTAEGAEGTEAAAARDLAGLISTRTGLPVELWDERMSTARALATVRELGGTTRGRKGDVDSMAASVMLQGWLEARRGSDSAGSPGAEVPDS